MSQSFSIYGNRRNGVQNRGFSQFQGKSWPLLGKFPSINSANDNLRATVADKKSHHVVKSSGLTRAAFSIILGKLNYDTRPEPTIAPAAVSPMEIEDRRSLSSANDLNRIQAALSTQYSQTTRDHTADEATLQRVENEIKNPYVFTDPSQMDVEEEVTGPSRIDIIDEQILLRKTELDAEEEANLKAQFSQSLRNNGGSVLITKFGIDMTGRKISCLLPNEWLNDEVVNFYMSMLQAKNDASVAAYNDLHANAIDGGSMEAKRTSHFFSSFFLTKLTEGNSYSYNLVKRWSKKFDVFEKDKIFIPVNINNTHWTMIVACIQRKEIHYYDSMSGPGQSFLKNIMRWVVDEGKAKKNITIDPSEWKLYDRYTAETVESICASSGNQEYWSHAYGGSTRPRTYVPQQENGFDCGMFSCICADFMSDDIPLVHAYSQSDMRRFRMKIGTDILRGKINY